jgi:hypothetical protein
MSVEVKNLLPEGYNAPCLVMVTGDIVDPTAGDKTVPTNYLNGFEGNTSLVEYMPHNDRMVNDSNIRFLYNEHDKKLYATTKYTLGIPLTDDQLEEIAKATQGQWSDGAGAEFQEPITTFEEEDCYVDPYHSGQKLYVAQLPIEIPQGHFWLGTIFDTPEKMQMYEDFMEHPVIYRRFVKMCEDNKIPVPEDATDSVMLPIHKRDRNTGEILISATVLKIFQQYQFAMNYLNTSEFPIGTAEHDLGKVLMLAPKFCDFMMHTAKMQEEGKEIHDLEGNYTKAMLEAIKYIEGKSELLDFYENFWANVE